MWLLRDLMAKDGLSNSSLSRPPQENTLTYAETRQSPIYVILFWFKDKLLEVVVV